MIVVFPFFPGGVITKGDIEAIEVVEGNISHSEPALRPDAFDSGWGGLEWESYAKGRDTHRTRRTTGRYLARNAEAEIIQQAGREGVGLVRQVILVDDGEGRVPVR